MKDRKEPYTETKIEISLFYLSDIIATSGPKIEDGTVDTDGWAQVLPMKFAVCIKRILFQARQGISRIRSIHFKPCRARHFIKNNY